MSRTPCPSPEFHPREDSQNELFDRILERVHHDLPDAIGLAITVHDRRLDEEEATVLAARGYGGEIVEAQLAGSVVRSSTHSSIRCRC